MTAPEITVHLVGGPPDWHGTTMTVQPDELDAGAALISVYPPLRPDDADPAPRAMYAPDPPPARATVWRFRGWFPTHGGDPGPDDYEAMTQRRVAQALADGALHPGDELLREIAARAAHAHHGHRDDPAALAEALEREIHDAAQWRGPLDSGRVRAAARLLAGTENYVV